MKCAPDQSSRWWLLALAFLVLLFASRTAWAQEPVLPSMPLSSPTLSEEPPKSPIEWRQQLVTLWNEYDSEFQNSILSLDAFLAQVEAFGISYEDLPKYIEFLESSYNQSETARITEQEAAEKALQAASKRIIEAEDALHRSRAIAAGFGAITGLLGLAFGLTFVF